jgi:hypothetical protein
MSHDELRALQLAADPLPWEAALGSGEAPSEWEVGGPETATSSPGRRAWHVPASQCTEGTARYIAAACNAVPGLLDEVERLQAELRWCEAQRKIALRELANRARTCERCSMDWTTEYRSGNKIPHSPLRASIAKYGSDHLCRIHAPPEARFYQEAATIEEAVEVSEELFGEKRAKEEEEANG